MDALHNKPVSRGLLFYLILLLSLAVLPHFQNLSIWIIGFFYSITGFRILLSINRRAVPSRWLMLPLTLLGIILVLIVVGFSEGRQFGVSLLVLMLSLKLLELKNRRDLYVTVILGYFLLITLFLFNKEMLLTIYVLSLSVGFTALLVGTNRIEESLKPWSNLSSAAKLIAGALPVMVLLFVFFPRLDGPLWTLNIGRGVGITGMSDNISLGSIGVLSLSEEVAFRVKFEGELPPPAQRYWRGLVLLWTDGNNWERGNRRAKTPTIITPTDEPLTYTVTMEPSGQKWLFPLDKIVAAPVNTLINSYRELSVSKSIDHRYSYVAQSSLEYWSSPEDADLIPALQLPANITPRVRDLVKEWQTTHSTNEALVGAALQHFNQQPFVYTLQPPILQNNPVDEFLFESRKGFCEHYATTFTVLMRLAGIPARVVVGYQGGELNPHGGHLIIRQSDAHAWSEVWLPDKGWTRVDPTAAIAPERIERSIDPFRSSEGEPVLFRVDNLGFISELARNARWWKDNMQLNWYRWIVGYNRNTQNTFLNNLGLSYLDHTGKGIVSTLGALIVAGLIFAYMVYRSRRRLPAAVVAYSIFKKKLVRAGMTIPVWLGPTALANRASIIFPGQAAEIRAITQQYISLRYGPRCSDVILRNLRKRVRKIRFRKP